jgi:hypothetical protein
MADAAGYPELPPLSEVAEAKYKQFHPEDVGEVYMTTASSPPAPRTPQPPRTAEKSDKGGDK